MINLATLKSRAFFIMKKKKQVFTRQDTNWEKYSRYIELESFSIYNILSVLSIGERNTSTITEYWAKVILKYFTIEKNVFK